MLVIGLVLFAMALGLGALFLLAKAQKENLGKLYSVSAYIVLTVSVLTILFAITAGIMHCCHKKSCGGGSCGKGKMEQGSHCGMKKGCSKTDGMCGATQSCSSMKSGHCSMEMEGCSGGGMKCSKGGDCMMMNPHGKMFEKKIIRKIDGDSVDVQVEVKTK